MLGRGKSGNDDDLIVNPKSSAELLEALQKRADRLLADLKAYQECLQVQGRQTEVEIRVFKRGIESEVKTLNTVFKSQPDRLDESHLTDFEIEERESNRMHALRSANLPFYEAVWDAARKCRRIVALGKRVYHQLSTPNPRETGQEVSANEHGKHDKKRSAIVDIVCHDGLQWIKVSTVTDKRLLFEMAKEGWEGYGDRSDSEEGEDDGHPNKNDHTQLELVRLAETLQRASRQVRVRFRHPRVHLVLPKIQEGEFEDVDSIIADIRSLGVTVHCENAMEFDDVKSPEFGSLRNHDYQDMSCLLPSPSFPLSDLTAILNVDCTILLALISDISHIHESDLPPYPPSGHYHKAITRQIAAENICPLLSVEIYGILSDRRLVCTADAAHRMREIVQTMGTDTEKQRASILLAENEFADVPADSLRQAMQRASCHIVPGDLNLPVRIVDFNVELDLDRDHTTETTPISTTDLHVLRQVSQDMELNVINRSVFLYGWALNITTVTSNRSVVAGIHRCIDQILDQRERDGEEEEVEFQGPKIYVCSTARSLIGKEKQGG